METFTGFTDAQLADDPRPGGGRCRHPRRLDAMRTELDRHRAEPADHVSAETPAVVLPPPATLSSHCDRRTSPHTTSAVRDVSPAGPCGSSSGPLMVSAAAFPAAHGGANCTPTMSSTGHSTAERTSRTSIFFAAATTPSFTSKASSSSCVGIASWRCRHRRAPGCFTTQPFPGAARGTGPSGSPRERCHGCTYGSRLRRERPPSPSRLELSEDLLG